MKIPFHVSRFTLHASRTRSRRRQEGMAVIVVLALISMVLLYVCGNLRTLHFLSRELKMLEQHQVRRLELYGHAGPPSAGRHVGQVPAVSSNSPPGQVIH